MLHRRAVNLAGRTIVGASVFPFFDASGAVQRLLIVDPDFQLLFVCSPSDLQRLPWVQPVVIKTARRLTPDVAVRDLSPLWHYDPWWVLTREPFASFEETCILKRTNCAEDFREDPSGMLFTGDLSWVRSVYTKTDSNYTERKFNVELMLPRAQRSEEPPQPSSRPGGWVLAPFWMADRQ